MAKSYAEKLKDPRWQKKRLEVLNRDGWRCQCCEGQDLELHVHHAVYRRNADPWDYDNSELASLCKSCHANVERIIDDFRRMLPRSSPSKLSSIWAVILWLSTISDDEALVVNLATDAIDSNSKSLLASAAKLIYDAVKSTSACSEGISELTQEDAHP